MNYDYASVPSGFQGDGFIPTHFFDWEQNSEWDAKMVLSLIDKGLGKDFFVSSEPEKTIHCIDRKTGDKLYLTHYISPGIRHCDDNAGERYYAYWQEETKGIFMISFYQFQDHYEYYGFDIRDRISYSPLPVALKTKNFKSSHPDRRFLGFLGKLSAAFVIFILSIILISCTLYLLPFITISSANIIMIVWTYICTICGTFLILRNIKGAVSRYSNEKDAVDSALQNKIKSAIIFYGCYPLICYDKKYLSINDIDLWTQVEAAILSKHEEYISKKALSIQSDLVGKIKRLALCPSIESLYKGGFSKLYLDYFPLSDSAKKIALYKASHNIPKGIFETIRWHKINEHIAECSKISQMHLSLRQFSPVSDMLSENERNLIAYLDIDIAHFPDTGGPLLESAGKMIDYISETYPGLLKESLSMIQSAFLFLNR